MSIFSALNIGLSGLQAQQAAVQTTGQNIANANTPGYSRQRVDLEASKPVNLGFAQMGTGVDLARVERIVDPALIQQINDATSQLGNLSAQKNTLDQVDAFTNPLQDQSGGIPQLLSDFFASFSQLAQDPENATIRNNVIGLAGTLSDQLHTLTNDLVNVRKQADDQIPTLVQQVDTLAQNIADLNKAITLAEKGGTQLNTANDLRDQRDGLVKQLSEILKVDVREQPTGQIDVSLQGNTLVSGGTVNPLTTQTFSDGRQVLHHIVFSGSASNAVISGGKLKGLLDVRDQTIGGFLNTLDSFAQTLIYEVNKIHSQGVGLTALTQAVSEQAVLTPALSTAPLARNGQVNVITSSSIQDNSLKGLPDNLFVGMKVLFTSGALQGQSVGVLGFDGVTGTLQLDGTKFPTMSAQVQSGDTFQVTGLPFPVQNGSFDVHVVNSLTQSEKILNIPVKLDTIGTDDSLQSIVTKLNNAFTGAGVPVTASISQDNRLVLASSDHNVGFTFANDTSHFLAAIGLNAFFKGSQASDINVSGLLDGNPQNLAVSTSALTPNNQNALNLANLQNQGVFPNGSTLQDAFSNFLSNIGLAGNKTSQSLTTQQSLVTQLENQRDRVSGVNIDEETANLIVYQRAFQASARFVSTVDQLLNTLLNI